MVNYFRTLVSKKRPDYIIDLQTTTVDQLTYITCRYCKKGHFYVACAFCTDVWLSSNPLGPLAPQYYQRSGRVSLEDVAQIHEFLNQDECTRFVSPVHGKLQDMLDTIQEKFVRTISPVVTSNQFGDTFSYKLILAPYPSLVLSINNTKGFVGTIIIVGDGLVIPGFAADIRLNTYVMQFEQMRSTWVPQLSSCVTDVGNKTLVDGSESF